MDQSDAMSLTSLMGNKIIGQHGRDIGVLTDILIDVAKWQLLSLEVKLNPEALGDLKLKRPWFGSQTIQVPASEISGATDKILVIKSPLEEMEFTGGNPV